MGVPSVEVSLISIFVTAIVGMAIGGLWYSQLLFGDVWMKLSGMSKKELAQAKQKGTGKMYAAAFIVTFISAYVLAHFVQYVTTTTFVEGMQLGFWLWLGFVMPVQSSIVLWENKSWKLFVLNTAYQLVSLLVMGGILAVWQ